MDATNTESTRIQVLTVVLTTILIAFLVNGLATILFPIWNTTSPRWTLVACSGLLVAACFVLYAFIVSAVRRSTTRITFPLTFSRLHHAFIDLPRAPMSVNARVCFERLPPEGQHHLAVYDDPRKFFGSELNRFIDQVVQLVLLTRVLFTMRSSQKHWTRLTPDHLGRGIHENQFAKEWIDEIREKRQVFAPYLQCVKTFGRNNSFLDVRTSGGAIRFTWAISFMTAPWNSEPFCPITADRMEFHDFEISLLMERDGNSKRIFSKKFKEFFAWSVKMDADLITHDWKSAQVERLTSLVQSLQKV
jgi:hypothetical protein